MLLTLLLTVVSVGIGFIGFDALYNQQYLLVIAAHFVASGIGMLIIKYRMNRVKGTYFPVLLNCCVPLVGALGVGVLTIAASNKGRKGLAEEYTLHIDPEEYRELFTRDSNEFNPNPDDLYSFSDILNADVPVVQKRVAIEGLAQMENPQTVAVLREALHMDSVEVRFFAASVLGKMEMRLEQKLLDLSNEDRGGVQLSIITELAQTYFDFVFFSLVEGARKDEYLDLAHGYALDALTIETGNSTLALVGRILIQKKKYKEAIQIFNLYVNEYKDDVKGWLWRSEAYLLQNDYIMASENARVALEMGGIPKPLEETTRFWAMGANNERAV